MAEGKKSNEKLILNKKEREWPKQFIKGAEIKTLAGSPADWAVNMSVPGGGEDPEIGDTQEVDLSEHAEPKGIKRFTTRKPATSPGQ
ncbi:multiubiquitin domain-containing protein [Bradyrhizobium sp. BWC-3-1]|uniref:multiubiquitin domain-containing protein n=1 Tax=Bradyrhizobium sp. BWC-3-1 TaxID=3080012 RepID=UPI00293F2549|nr:multiubiquitin domain-containing protein [Bradyrhizobium sp. BWC-3-1]WOH57647.1 multiubiquitin domain-containing protein [Bradyrhizobium sp. BWC-3-1]